MSQGQETWSVPEEWALSLSDVFARYMVSRFNSMSSGTDLKHTGLDTSRLSLRALCEADRMVRILLQAYRNKVVIDTIDIIRLGEKANIRQNGLQTKPKTADEAEIMINSESKDFELLTEPSVIIERSGYILLWYLPGFVSDPNQDYMWQQLHLLRTPLHRSISSRALEIWRTSERFFRAGAELRGAINLAPAWFQQGRNGETHDPEVSALLKKGQEHNGCRRWLEEMHEHSALLSASLAIMNPEMYAAGQQAMLRLSRWSSEQKNVEMQAILPVWPSVFSVVSVMANRMSPLHTDRNGRPQLFDLLVTVGNYRDLDIAIPTVSRRFRYNPGSAIAFSGQMLQHGVGQCDDDRAVLSFYMRDNVHQFVDVPRSNYMDYSKVGQPFL